MSYPEPIAQLTHVRGDRWPSMVFGPIIIDGSTPSGALARVRVQWRKGSLVFTADSTDDGDRDVAITLTNPTTWIATIAQLTTFLPEPGVWTWDDEFYETGVSAPWTLHSGTVLVKADQTRPAA